MAEFSVIPLGLGSSLADPIAEVRKIVEDSGIRHQLTPAGTCLEGEWDEVMTVIRQCHARLLGRSTHVITAIRIEGEIGMPHKLNHHPPSHKH